MQPIKTRTVYIPCLFALLFALLFASIFCSSVYADIFKPLKDAAESFTPIKHAKEALKPLKDANVFGNKFEAIAVGSLAPDFTLKSLSGKNIRLEEKRGKTVLITFWASWCGPCRIELPHFQKLQHDIGKDKIEILAVSADSKLQNVSSFSKELSLNIPMLFDPGLEVNRLYRVRAMPTTFIIDSSGVIRHIHMGFKESVLPLYEKELRALANH
ncbi:MAG: TlpA family protein disulfide reductase [Pseudomonadales bacterium]|nr:TlpA family protein disulfide reductase [Pseudomonadales bacterium]